MRLRGSRALITGGASGIGKATARRLLKDGAQIAIADVDAGAVDRSVGELQADGTVLGLVMDVTDWSEVERQTRAALRVCFKVVEEPPLVTVRSIGIKDRDRVLINGEEVELR